MATINKPKRKVKPREATGRSKEIYDKVYNTPMWRNIRKGVLITHPLCQRCLRTLATEVHHIKPLSTAADDAELYKLAFDSSNLIALCSCCHYETHRDLKKEKQTKERE